MRSRIVSLAVLLVAAAGFSSCEKYFGNKTDLDFIEVPDYDAVREVAYVPILPVLDQFMRPTDVTVGFDELIYVVDEASEEVVALDESGRELGRMFIPGARSVAQDRAFDLLVIGTFDTTLIQGSNTVERTLSCIYRIDQFAGGSYNLNSAKISSKVVHPFYYKSSANDFDEVEYVGFRKIAIIGNNNDPNLNNQYYVTRAGESTTGTLGPDDAVLYFRNDDSFISTINVSTSSGVFNDYFEDPSGIVTNTQPPQLEAQGGRSFFYTSLDESNALQVQFLRFIETEFGSYYQPELLASGDTSKADGFINEPGKFSRPVDMAMAGDASRYLFVVDEGTDSLYQFTATGFEGVQPPAATGISKFQKTSFGGTGNGVREFRNPQAVAYFKRVVYVADTDNGRVLRFKLTTDFR